MMQIESYISEGSRQMDLKERVREYLDTYAQQVESLERPLYSAVCEYLMLNARDPEKCTLRVVARELGIPYSKARRYVENLIEEGVLKQNEIGRAKPLAVRDLEKALRMQYLSPGFSDFLRWITAPTDRGKSTVGSAERAAAQLSCFPRHHMPAYAIGYLPSARCEEVLLLSVLASDHVPESMKQRLRNDLRDSDARFVEGLAASGQVAGGSADGCIVEAAAAKFEEYLGFKPRSEMFDAVCLDIAVRRGEEVRGLEELILGLGMWPMFTVPYVYTIACYYFDEWESVLWPRGMWSREVWFELGCPEQYSEEQAMNGARKIAEKQLKYLLALAERSLDLVRHDGIEGALSQLNRPSGTHVSGEVGWKEYRPEVTASHLLYQVIPLGCAILACIGMDGDREIILRARAVYRLLRGAVELNYRGLEAEGKTLELFLEERNHVKAG
jgi:hypothetical protein